jgi:CheY-like chemotaxis protein
MILFVEDDSLSRRAFAQILRAEGYQVAEAGNGAEALEILTTGAEVLTNEAFDLVIADLVLPGLHGVNLVHQIRARWPKMPVIVISGYHLIGRSHEAGVLVELKDLGLPTFVPFRERFV